MNRVITISREFGSGGREIGRRLAEELQIAYYDNEVVEELAKKTNFTEEYIKRIEEQKPYPLFPITIGRTFSPMTNSAFEQRTLVFSEQSSIITQMAQTSDCVIVGRCADYILHEYNPLRLFVYADMDFKMARCREKGETQKDLTDKALRRKILSVDKERSKYYQFYTGQSWGEKTNYDLCLNTTTIEIKKAAILLAGLIRSNTPNEKFFFP
ncbi:cytidylate kinase-like family protein [Kineothrix sp. MB12-C1]|uniref:cytidylate kinase-like family protein n=1 Tax=Kineothrix sp. MB12-C1 TaxID=3070215 RepID=UPI0027D2AFA5|nr:cytidylate kinase-like family protein [Kineothrix sp. MB12-C1]WMC92518.1 cytidylate kinase-like family protein [Kineothrix sp. MB12-C1]